MNNVLVKPACWVFIETRFRLIPRTKVGILNESIPQL